MFPPVNVAVIYYSSTGSVHRLAEAVADGAAKVGAEVRLRRAAELAPPAAIASNPAWAAHVEETAHIPEPDMDDLRWADAVVFGTPTRFGLPASQLKQFIDRTGPLWDNGELAGKVYASFTSTATAHGGQESTILALNNTFYHWGGIIVPPGYTDPIQFVTGNPYGASSVVSSDDGPADDDVASAEFMGARIAEIASQLRRGAAAA